MVKSVEKGDQFSEILGGYLTEVQAQELVSKLEIELQGNPEDKQLAGTIAKLKSFYEKPPEPNRTALQWFWLYFVVAFHFFIIIGNIAAVFALPFLMPWYVSIPLISLIINLNFTPTKCPLTSLEDRIRRSMGLPEIKLFIRYYVILPYRRWKKKRRKKGA